MATMRSEHIAMTMEEFELMPWRLGWKYEYWQGRAHITPRHQTVPVKIEVNPRSVNCSSELRAVDWKDEPDLISAFLAAFRNTIEYCDWNRVKIDVSGRDAIHGFLAGRRGTPHPSSRLAVLAVAAHRSVQQACVHLSAESAQ